MKDFLTKAERVRLLILDVDGILTDGKIYVSSRGEESKAFHIRDGYALKLLQRAGIPVVLLSGRRSESTRIRAEELGIQEVHQGALDKVPVYEDILRKRGMLDDEVAVMGDDVMDVPLLLRAGLSATVPDGVQEVKEVVDYVTRSRGGEGAVREFAELILKARGLWDLLVEGLQGGSSGEP